MELSPANYRDWRAMTTSFAGDGRLQRDLGRTWWGRASRERLEGAAVTSDLLPLLGVRPLLGRLFTAEDDREGVGGTVLLSYGLWQSRFGGDAGVLGPPGAARRDARTT